MLFQKRRMKYKTMPFSGGFSKVILCDLGLGSVLGLYRCSFSDPTRDSELSGRSTGLEKDRQREETGF